MKLFRNTEQLNVSVIEVSVFGWAGEGGATYTYLYTAIIIGDCDKTLSKLISVFPVLKFSE